MLQPRISRRLGVTTLAAAMLVLSLWSAASAAPPVHTLSSTWYVANGSAEALGVDEDVAGVPGLYHLSGTLSNRSPRGCYVLWVNFGTQKADDSVVMDSLCGQASKAVQGTYLHPVTLSLCLEGAGCVTAPVADPGGKPASRL